MTDPAAPHVIKKYPNRRFYDVSRSSHVTLTDLYELVKSGQEIQVIDSRTGEDITNIVLTQIILEHDPPKLALFPASLLHQAIQANQQMVRRFIDQYFAQAMDAFVRSRNQFDDFLKQSGFSPLSPTAPFDWVRMLFPGVGQSAPRGMTNPPASHDAAAPADAETVEALRSEIATLSRELEEMRSDGASTSSRRSRKKKKKTRTQRKAPRKSSGG